MTRTSDNDLELLNDGVAHFAKVDARVVLVDGVDLERPLPGVLLAYLEALVVAVLSNARSGRENFAVVLDEEDLQIQIEKSIKINRSIKVR